MMDGKSPPVPLLPRRAFLARAGLGTACASVANLLRAEAAAGVSNSRKAVVIVHLDGGPPQMDMFDPKPHAPAEVRGEFGAISSAVPGLHLSETLPLLAEAADDFIFVRSLVGSAGRHDAFQCQSGYGFKDLESIGGRPAIGSVVSRLLGTPSDVAPAFVDLMQGRPLVRNSARPGFLGPAFQPFRPDISGMFQRELEAGMKNELARLGGEHRTSLVLSEGLTSARLDNRTQLLAEFDRLQRSVDGSGMMAAMDEFTQQAVRILTSGRLAKALDLEQEDPRVLQRYTPSESGRGEQSRTSEGPESARKFLLARRLIDAGVRVVSISISDFDTHSRNFTRLRQLLPIVDHGLTTLTADLKERGMLDDVLIVAWGEFGRTPRVNSKAGRDHWPRVGPALLAGGGLPTGQVIGATDRLAAEVTERPVTYKDIFAVMYRHLGLDPLKVTLLDPHGRPQYLLDDGTPPPEML